MSKESCGCDHAQDGIDVQGWPIGRKDNPSEERHFEDHVAVRHLDNRWQCSGCGAYCFWVVRDGRIVARSTLLVSK